MAGDAKTLRGALDAAIARLTENDVGSPRMNAETLLMFTLGCDRAYLYAHPERTLTSDEQAVAEGLRGAEERLGSRRQVASEAGLAVAVEDDQVQGPGVEIDAGIESGVGGWREGTHGAGLQEVREEAAGCHLHHRRREPS